jgi:hypothetical protein
VSRLVLKDKVPAEYNRHTFADLLEQIEVQLNGVTEGKISARHSARASVPTTGSFKQGDFIPNSTPAELGSGGSKYVIIGWICTVSGEPGTLLQCRVLTGN